MTKRAIAIAIAMLLGTACLAGPSGAPSDRDTSRQRRAAATTSLSTLQGGLVDIRYGQVSIDQGGVGAVLDLDAQSRLTLDGSAITAEKLLERVPEGLAVAVRYNSQSGLIARLDAFGSGNTLASVEARLLPWKGPAYTQGETVTVLVPAAEAKRLGANEKLLLTVPGVAHDLQLTAAQNGGRKVTLRVQPGVDLVDVPLLLKAGPRVYQAGRLSFATTPPRITGFGPHSASAKLRQIPGWVDLRSSSRMLDPSSAKLSVSQGARVVEFQPRADRSVFTLEADGPGEYWLEFSVSDRLGRTVHQRWPLRVVP